MGPVEEERSLEKDAIALKACENDYSNKDKTKYSVSMPAEKDKKPEIKNEIMFFVLFKVIYDYHECTLVGLIWMINMPSFAS